MIDSGSLAAASDVCRTVVAYCGICMWGTTWFVDLRVRRKSWFVDLRCLTFLFSVCSLLWHLHVRKVIWFVDLRVRVGNHGCR